MKRANGTGSIVKLSGNRRRPYTVRVSAHNQFGQIIQESIGYYRTASEAQAALDEYNRLKQAGKAPKPDTLSMTVQQVYDAWSAREFARLNPASITSHQAAWKKRISRFADRKMRSVTLDEWQSIIDEDNHAGRSQSLINNDAILIKALSAYAMKRDIIGKDYSAYLEIPSVNSKKAKGAFSEYQLEKLKSLANDQYPWADTVLMLCYTGFRISEFLSLTPNSYHPENGGYLQGGLKTNAGINRIVPVHPTIAPYLERRLSDNAATIISHNGSPVSPSWYRQYAFPAVMQQLEVPEATPHWCRHTFATMLHSVGCDSLTVKWLLGHSTKSDITSHYTHETIAVLRNGIMLLK